VQYFVKLLIFWTLFSGVIALLLLFPHSRLTRLAGTWHGPEPTIGETLGRYYWRRCIWVLQLLGQSIAVLFGLALLIRWQPVLQGTPVEIFAMAVPLIAFILLVTAGWYAVAAAKARWVGPNPTFEDPDHVVEA
jgi:hypothetical protein